MVEQAVGDNLHFDIGQLGRQTTQGFDETRISVNLERQAGIYLVVRTASLVEVFVAGGYFLERIGHVKRPSLLLGVEENRQLVRLREDMNHLLALTLIITLKELLRLSTLYIGGFQLRVQFVQGIGQRMTGLCRKRRKSTCPKGN